jgi:hypothetical protein
VGARALINKDVSRNWVASNPATIGFAVAPPIDDDMLHALENLRDVDTVSGWQQEKISWRNNPGEHWKSAMLFAIDDYEDQQLRTIKQIEGGWLTASLWVSNPAMA